jgi:hypothetical protein
MNRNKIPEDIGDYVRYDGKNLYWTVDRKPYKSLGKISGSVSENGYMRLMFRGKKYLSHRVIWFLVNKEQPPEYLDHINNDRLDNRIENLRAVSSKQNTYNTVLNIKNTSGVKGVSWHKHTGKWQARMRINDKEQYLGIFDNIEDAERVMKETREKIHGEYANHG